jgi:phospholipase A2
MRKSCLIIFFCIKNLFCIQDFSSSLSPEESNFCKSRAKVIGDSWNIALCLSGGGYRAMLASLGFIKGAQKIGLLNSSMYISALSGSTWMLGNLLARKITTDKICDFEKILKERVTNACVNKENILQAIENSKKLIPWRDTELVDIYGICVTERILGDQDYGSITLSNIIPIPSDFPFPLFTAVCDTTKKTNILNWLCSFIAGSTKYEWIEINSYWTEIIRFSKAIKTSFLGSTFSAGNILIKYPEVPLSFILGVCGSAFSLSVKDILNYISEEMSADKKHKTSNRSITDIISAFWESLEHGRICPPRIPNFLYKVPRLSKLAQDDEMIIHDAGTDFNLPLPPLLKNVRNIKLIVICDASDNASLEEYPEFKKAKKYASRYKIPFPSVRKPVAKNAYACVFANNSLQNVPVIVYIPLLKYQYSTFKFSYSTEEFDNVVGYMEQAVLNSRDLIQDSISSLTKNF